MIAGASGFVYGFNRCPDFPNFPHSEDYKKEFAENQQTKYDLVIHAEEDAIDNFLLQLGFASHGDEMGGARHLRPEPGTWTMYAPWAACLRCARRIVQVGIRNVWVHGPRMQLTVERQPNWVNEVNAGLAFLQKYGVAVHVYPDPLNVTALVAGSPVTL